MCWRLATFSLILSIFSLLGYNSGYCQAIQDTIPVEANSGSSGKGLLALDTATVKEFVPRKATIRSAILPGWGQAYNKKYWKIPIVYGALGVSAGVFVFNLKTYKEFRHAVQVRSSGNPANDSLIPPDIRPLSTPTLTLYRNAYRSYIDYSVVAFILLWGLNVVDATVDAHLKAFNVSPDLSLKIKPGYRYETRTSGLSLVLQFNKQQRLLPLPNEIK